MSDRTWFFIGLWGAIASAVFGPLSDLPAPFWIAGIALNAFSAGMMGERTWGGSWEREAEGN